MSSAITVERREHIHQPSILCEAFVETAHYISGRHPHLLQVVVFGNQRKLYLINHQLPEESEAIPLAQVRRSDDNGRTWRAAERWLERQPLNGRRYLSRFYPWHLYYHATGTICRCFNAAESIEGLVPWDEQSPEMTHARVMTQYSYDCGQTWTAPQPLIVSGSPDERRWAPGIVYGQDRGTIDNDPLYLDERTVLLPLARTCYVELGTKEFREKTAILIGRWRDDGRTLDWDIGSHLALSPKQSDQGGGEASLSMLPGGRLFVTLRVRIYGHGRGHATGPSCQFCAYSDDLGKTWSSPEPLRYEDGQIVYCPASIAKAFCSSRTGHHYLITNILDKPTTDCDPRTSLQIAEIDPKKLCLRRDSVTVIEQRDPNRGDSPTIRYSNWSQYEDRETGELVILMTGSPGNQGRHEQCGVPPHAYIYRVGFAS